MSGQKLNECPDTTSIPMAYATSKIQKTIKSVLDKEVSDLIYSVGLSELESKIMELISTNPEIFPSTQMEKTLKKAHEAQDKIFEIIRAIYREVNEKPHVSKDGRLLNTGTKESDFEGLIKELITENVNSLLSLGKNPNAATLTDIKERISSKIKSLISEHFDALLNHLLEVGKTLKDYADRIDKIKSLRVLAEKGTTDNENPITTTDNGNSGSLKASVVIDNTKKKKPRTNNSQGNGDGQGF